MKMPNDASTMLMFTIVNRGLGEKIIHLFTEHGVTYNLLMLGRGTASTEILEYLGLGATEKELLLSLTPRYIAKELLMQLDEKLNLNKPGSGIAFTVPLSSVAGSIAINYVKGLPQPETGSEDHMEQECNHDLIITIVDRGYSDEVMHAARSADATGGTVIHARGTGHKEAQKFFGVTIQPEKELVLILTPSEKKQNIMSAIASQVGSTASTKAFVFSLHVSDVSGTLTTPKQHK
jgi:nitrogen regulatory protein PII